MQVHDELVLEVRETELAHLQATLPNIMATVAEGVLAVPLIAEVGIGANWEAAHQPIKLYKSRNQTIEALS